MQRKIILDKHINIVSLQTQKISQISTLPKRSQGNYLQMNHIQQANITDKYRTHDIEQANIADKYNTDK